MPAIQVARTDTFEQQRQKINQLGTTLFNITAGGSDLSTGNLKLGDGTRVAPSLSFVSDPGLGIYKPDEKTIGYVSDGKKVADFAPTGFYSFRDLILQQKSLTQSGISIIDTGDNYDPGTYTSIPLVGGTGENAVADIVISSFTGSVTNYGKNYTVGSYTNIPLSGGTGSGAVSSFEVEGISGNITNPGSGYVPGSYTNIALSDGTGTGALATLTIGGSTTLSGSITSPGSGYTTGSYTQIQVFNKPTQTFTVTTVNNPGTPPPTKVFSINGTTQQSLTLVKGNTYRFDTSNASNSGFPLTFSTSGGAFLSSNYSIITVGSPGSSGSFVDLIIKPSAPNETIIYASQSASGMGANISVTTGTSGSYGVDGIANVVVGPAGTITSFSFSSTGSGYKQNDIVQVASGSLVGNGSGFEFTLNSPVYSGTITNVSITNIGQNYEIGDVLTVNNSLVGGNGSGFQFTISSNPGKIKNLTFSAKGSGYSVNDVLTLPLNVTGVSSTLKGDVNNVSTTLSTSTATITVSSTTGIIPGMQVLVSQGSTGVIPSGTTVLSVDSLTQITLSQNPTTSGAATLRFLSSGNLSEITVSSTSGIIVGSTVTKTSGSGVLAANTTISSINSLTNTIILSSAPTTAGSVVLTFSPPFGQGTVPFSYTISNIGSLDSITLTSGGNGYSLGDSLSINSYDLVQPIVYNVKNNNVQKLTFVSTLPSNTFSVGSFIKLRDGSVSSFSQTTTPTVTPNVVGPLSTTLSTSSTTVTVSNSTGIVAGMFVTQNQADTGKLSQNTKVSSVNGNQITLSANPTTSGSASLTFTEDKSGTYTNISSTTSGSGTGSTFDIVRSSSGVITSITSNSLGYFYQVGDTITIQGNLVGGSSPTHNIVLTVSVASIGTNLEIYKVETSGGNISSITVAAGFLENGSVIVKSTSNTPTYTINTATGSEFRFFIDTGSGYQLTPNLTFYVGNTYRFNLADGSNSGHVFSLSKFRDGIWSPSKITGITSTLSTSNKQITISNTTGILVGMTVQVSSGSGGLLSGTVVSSIDSSTQLTLSEFPITSGSSTLTFSGSEYTNGVSRSSSNLTIKVTNTTPNLYYYCATNSNSHQNEGGDDNNEALITVNQNNPKIFGNGLSLSVSSLSSIDIISANIFTGELKAVKFSGTSAVLTSASVSGSLTAPNISGNSISLTSITSTSSLSLSAATSVSISSDLNIGSNVQILNSSGNITTSGVLKTTNSLNINDRINITNNVISSTSGNNILLTPATGRVAKVNTTSAITIPSGTTAQRPAAGIVESGSIRFNTDTGQYEGYSGATSSWSSLGGVRDLDGNTYIAAEASVGANDNTLYFYNDGNNTVKVTPTRFIFNVVKNIDSPNPLNPPSTEWAANTPVALNSYVYYGLNLYKVTTAGTTGTSGNEPTHTTGTVANGTAQLLWYSDYAGDVTFDKVANINVKTNIVFNDELKLYNNKITTLLSDVVIEPFAGKKVDINTNTSLVLPNGTTAQRGIPGQGSVRFNTSLSQFEGYNGTNWTSLGGVRDVDGNTYIIPETSPGANENILYFYNNGSNTLRLSATELTFDTIDQIGSTSNNLDLQAQTVTFNSLALTVDNSGSSTKLLSTKTNIDFALSVGLFTNPLLRLNTTGDILVNKGFGTASDSYIKVLDNELKSFELDDAIVSSSEYILTKGTTNSGASVIFDPTLHSGAKVIVVANNTTTNHKDMIEFAVIAKDTDIFQTEYGNLVSGTDIITPTFDFDAGGKVRLNVSLVSGVTTGNVVNITVVSTIIKK